MVNNKRDDVSGNGAKAVMISRLLTPENKPQLLAWARLAYTAENSVRKQCGFDSALDGIFVRKSQEYSCGDILTRRKEK